MKKLNNYIQAIFRSNKFYYALILIFVFESAWIALTARYPMAFDEDFHLGIIKIYSHQFSPFFNHQPSNADQFGALTNSPSYLYHYLLSFPYRIFHYFYSNDTANIIFLRILNIGMFVSSIAIFRNLFLKYYKVSNSIVNVSVLFFILTPLVPLLAAQINYDNMLILLVSINLTLLTNFIDGFKNKNIFKIRTLLLLISLCMITSLVQYAFLPIFAVIVFYLIGLIFKIYRNNKDQLYTKIIINFKKLSLSSILLLSLLFILSLGLFAQRDLYNTYKYGTPVPDCSKVLSVNACKSYSPWDRNYVFANSKSSDVDYNALNFTGQWLHLYFFYSLFYALNGASSNFAVGGPLPLTQIVGIAVFIGGLFLLILYRNKITENNNLIPVLFTIIVVYVLTLWLQNYTDFLKTGVAVAEQGRYLIVLLLPAFLVVALAFSQLLKKYSQYKSVFTVSILVLFLQGGGVTTYMLTSDSTWYWQNSYAVSNASHTAKKVLNHVIVHKKN